MNGQKTFNIIALIGESGCGKSFFRELVCRVFPEEFKSVIQVTTRNPRQEEVLLPPEESYLFLGEEAYDCLLDEKKLFAYSVVNGKRYGSLLDSMDSKKTNVLIVNALGYRNTIDTLLDFEVKTKIMLVRIINDRQSEEELIDSYRNSGREDRVAKYKEERLQIEELTTELSTNSVAVVELKNSEIKEDSLQIVAMRLNSLLQEAPYGSKYSPFISLN